MVDTAPLGMSIPVNEIVNLDAEAQISAVGGIVKAAIAHYGDDIEELVYYLSDLRRDLDDEGCEGGRYLPGVIKGMHINRYAGMQIEADTQAGCNFIDMYSSEDVQRKIFDYQHKIESSRKLSEQTKLRRNVSGRVSQLLEDVVDTKITTSNGLQSWSEQIFACFKKYEAVFSAIERAGDSTRHSDDSDPRIAGSFDLAAIESSHNMALIESSDALQPFFEEIGTLLDQIDTGFMPEIFRTEPQFGFDEEIKTRVATKKTEYPHSQSKFLAGFPPFLSSSVYRIPHKERYEEVINNLKRSFELVVLEYFLEEQKINKNPFK